MMLQIMVYTIAVAAMLSVVGLCLERLARLRALPRRGAWVGVMLLSVLFPVAMILRAPPPAVHEVAPVAAEASVPQFIQQPVAPAEFPATTPPVQVMPGEEIRQPSSWNIPAPTDRQIIAAWVAASSAIGLYLLGANLMLRRRAAGWQRAAVLGREVLVSEVTGPALLGVLQPRIVVPRWLLLQPAATQTLVMEHEHQHERAMDPLLIVAGLLVIAAVPWNLPLWWQWRRLRQAMELDCDARVMRSGAEPTTYAQVLLEITQRATRMPAGTLAMTEPVNALERRIESLVPDAIRYGRSQTLAVLLLAAVGAGAAMALEAPALPGRPSEIVTVIVPQISTTLAASAPASFAMAAAAQPASSAAAPAPGANRSEPAAQSQSPVQPAAVPTIFRVRVTRTDTGAADADAVVRLDRYYGFFMEELRAVPGLGLVTQGVDEVPGLEEAAIKLGVSRALATFEVAVTLGADGKAINIEALPRGQSRPSIWWSTDSNVRPGSGNFAVPVSRLPAVLALPENAERDMENLVERMRMDLFPRDYVRLDRWLSELRDPRLEASVRLAALEKLKRDSRRDADPLRAMLYLPDPALIHLATEFAMTASDPATRIRVWQSFRGLQTIPWINPVVLVAPAIRALAAETDSSVRLELVDVLGMSSADPGAHAALESVAVSDRQELVRMAARRVLHGNDGWNDYFVSRLNDPKVSAKEQLELIRYTSSIRRVSVLGSALDAAALQLQPSEAALRSLGKLLNKAPSREIAAHVASLLNEGGTAGREELVDFLRAGTGQPVADKETRRTVLSYLTSSSQVSGRAIAPDIRPLMEDISGRDLDPELRETARQALQAGQ